ncbi:hypothetical protein D8T57_09910 [Vibrio vulnificus]|nr:hypothetical protein D8T57_09910 [Vibrio vulnificus]
MDPRLREDDEKKTKRKSRQTEVRKKKVRRVKDERKHQQHHYPVKISTPPPRHQASFPCTRESIHPHAPDVAFGNALTTDNNIERN